MSYLIPIQARDGSGLEGPSYKMHPNQAKAAEHAARVLPIIREIQATGAITLRAIAAELTARKVPTARGGDWAAQQVSNILKRADINKRRP